MHTIIALCLAVLAPTGWIAWQALHITRIQNREDELQVSQESKKSPSTGTGLKLPFMMALLLIGGCTNGPLYGHTGYSRPTLNGNIEVEQTVAAGGAIQSTSARYPNGRALVDRCIQLQREGATWLRQQGIEPNQQSWTSWMQRMNLITMVDRCIDHVTFNAPMNTGGGGYGGIGGGITWKKE